MVKTMLNMLLGSFLWNDEGIVVVLTRSSSLRLRREDEGNSVRISGGLCSICRFILSRHNALHSHLERS